MPKIDKKFVAQYQAAYADGKISQAEAKKLAKSADGNKAREEYLRDHLRQDTFESPDARKLVEKAVGDDTRRASGFVGQTIGTVTVGGHARDVQVQRELGDPKGYLTPGEARLVAAATGKDAAVVFGADGRWRALEVSAGGASIANAKRSVNDHDAVNTQFMAAPAPAKVKAEAVNSWVVDFNPPVTDAKAAAQVVFGSDKVPEGFILRRTRDMFGQPEGTGWELTVLGDEKREYPNNIPWDKYQAQVKPSVQDFLYKNLPSNLNVPRPGSAPKVLSDPDAAVKAKKVTVTGWSSGTTVADTLGGVKSIDVSSYDVDFGKKMTRTEVEKFFWEQKGTPMNSSLEPLPKGAKAPSAQWRVIQPHHWTTDERAKGIHPILGLHMAKQMTSENRRTPEWIGEKTAKAIKAKQLPPAGVEVKRPKPGIATWREGNGVFWFNEKTGQVQGFPRKHGRGPGADMWNNWNTSYIMDHGLSPSEAGPKVVADMESTNRQILMAFAQAMAANRAPEAGVVNLGVKAVDVTGKLGLHDQPTGTDDVIEKAREAEAQRPR